MQPLQQVEEPRSAMARGVCRGVPREPSPLGRPHPWAPNKPPLNIATNAGVAPLDFARDLVRFEGAVPL